jgi:hypothetical protein
MFCKGDGLLRIGDVLRWTPVSSNAGNGSTALSFQRGYFPIFEASSRKISQYLFLTQTYLVSRILARLEEHYSPQHQVRMRACHFVCLITVVQCLVHGGREQLRCSTRKFTDLCRRDGGSKNLARLFSWPLDYVSGKFGWHHCIQSLVYCLPSVRSI